MKQKNNLLYLLLLLLVPAFVYCQEVKHLSQDSLYLYPNKPNSFFADTAYPYEKGISYIKDWGAFFDYYYQYYGYEKKLFSKRSVMKKYLNGQKELEGRMFVKLNSIGPTGRWIVWYNNGQKYADNEYIKGEPTGKWLFWYPNGKLKSEREYAKGKPIGKWVRYYDNGQKMEEGEHLYDDLIPVRNGKWVGWYKNGQKRYEGEYIFRQDKIGKWIIWDENGNIISEATYEKNKLSSEFTGKIIYWNESGQKKEEVSYINGRNNGKTIYWYDNGQKAYEGELEPCTLADGSECARQTGMWTQWSENGEIAKVEIYENGKLLKVK